MDILGIDIAKLTFDATLLTTTGTQHYQSFANTAEGFTQLQAWLTPVWRQERCMPVWKPPTSTGKPWRPGCHAHGHTVSVVNPARIKGYAQATMQRNKTDKLDSAAIASFCGKHQPECLGARQRGAPPLASAGAASRRPAANPASAAESPARHQRQGGESLAPDGARALGSQLKAVEQVIKEHLARTAELRANLELLTSIVGIGVITAAKLLAEFGDIESTSRPRRQRRMQD